MSAPRKLTDVLRQTSPGYLKKSAAQAQRAMREIQGEELQTRFMRNHFLIDPKALQLIVDHDKLNKYRTFAIYKPAFCPMRRADAEDNYHRVSIESFLNAAMKSRELLPILRTIDDEDAARANASPRDLDVAKAAATDGNRGQQQVPVAASSSVKVRVLNDYPTFYSGPLVVSLQEGPGRPVALRRGAVHFDVLTMGHEPPKQHEEDVNPALLFPKIDAKVLADAAVHPQWPLRCAVKVDRIGYYAVHPVTLLRISVFNPISASAPDVEQYIRNERKTFVVGDNQAFDGTGESGGDPKSRRFNYGNVSRGDFDFPRLFVHARSVSVDVDVMDAQMQVIGAKEVDFHCRNCFEPLIKPERSVMLKRNRIQLVDGSWSRSML